LDWFDEGLNVTPTEQLWLGASVAGVDALREVGLVAPPDGRGLDLEAGASGVADREALWRGRDPDRLVSEDDPRRCDGEKRVGGRAPAGRRATPTSGRRGRGAPAAGRGAVALERRLRAARGARQAQRCGAAPGGGRRERDVQRAARSWRHRRSCARAGRFGEVAGVGASDRDGRDVERVRSGAVVDGDLPGRAGRPDLLRAEVDGRRAQGRRVCSDRSEQRRRQHGGAREGDPQSPSRSPSGPREQHRFLRFVRSPQSRHGTLPPAARASGVRGLRRSAVFVLVEESGLPTRPDMGRKAQNRVRFVNSLPHRVFGSFIAPDPFTSCGRNHWFVRDVRNTTIGNQVLSVPAKSHSRSGPLARLRGDPR
jgi:hypothetical protein